MFNDDYYNHNKGVGDYYTIGLAGLKPGNGSTGDFSWYRVSPIHTSVTDFIPATK